MVNKHMKNAQHCSLLEKSKSNYDEVSPHTGQNGPSSENLQTINAEEGVEEREPSCIIGGNSNWYSHSGEEYGGSLKN